MNCPKCNTQLTLSQRLAIEIDFCPECRGVWLDRGELDKIIERSARSDDRGGHDDQRYDEGDDNRFGSLRPKKKKREGFLGDLFDF